MRTPFWLKSIIGTIVLVAIAAGITAGFQKARFIEIATDVSLILTLAAILAYVHYTYVLAEDAARLSVSYFLQPLEDDPFHFAFLIINHSKHPVQCWCKLNASVYNQKVQLEGFYGGLSPIDLQPRGAFQGHFRIDDILKKVERTSREMKEKFDQSKLKEQLYLDIEFNYAVSGSNQKTSNPKQPHYFDFSKDQLVADF